MNPLWVIGGTSGIGKAVASAARKSGKYEVETSGEDTDVKYQTDIDRLVRQLGQMVDDMDTPPCVVYSAGINKLDWITHTDEADIFDIFDTNTFGFMRFVTTAARKGWGDVRLVAISSDAAVRPMRTSMAYCSSKAALNMAVKVAARELADRGWRVNAVSPGMTSNTKMTEYIDETVPALRSWTKADTYKYENQQAVIKRRATPEEVADMVLSVLQMPDYVNGEIFTINGGR